MLKRCAVLVLALLPLAASAQTIPSVRSAPGAAGPQGISVQGRGSARFPVKTVTFVAFTRGNADEAAVLSAMRAAGIDDPTIGVPGSQINNGGQMMVRGTIRDVTRAKLDRIARAASAYVLAHPGATVDNVNFSAAAEDCAQYEQTARTAAFADARRRAEAIAALAGVTLEGVAAVSEIGGCPLPVESAVQPFAQGAVPFDLSTLTATISVNESITFAITPAPAPARRRTL